MSHLVVRWGAKGEHMPPNELLDATLEPGISNSRPVARVESLDLRKGDRVRLRVTKRGQRQPDHIATYEVFDVAPTKYPARVLAARVSAPEPVPPG